MRTAGKACTLSTPQDPQHPGKSRPPLWMVLGTAGGFLLLVAIGAITLMNFVGGATNKARGLADDFNTLIIAGDAGTAYDKHLDPTLREKLSREDFAAGVRGLELNGSCKPNYTELRASSSNGAKGADVAGSLDCDGKTIELAYRFEGTGELNMVNIRLKPQA